MEKRNLGNEINDIVQKAINMGNYQGLNKDVQNLVKGAFNEIKTSFNWDENTRNKGMNHTEALKERLRKEKEKAVEVSSLKEIKARDRYIKPVGQVSGVLFSVFGSLASVIFGIAMFIMFILGSVIGPRFVFHTIGYILTPFFLVSLWSSINGFVIQKRLKRIQRYVARLGDKDYCEIKVLAGAVGLSPKDAAEDLRKMIKLGMFPEGHVDDYNNYFMLNNESYGEYLKLQEGLRLQKIEAEKNPKISGEAGRIIDEGRRFVQDIRRANDDIPGEEISRKLDRLEDVTEKIFDYVESHPEKCPEIRKFSDYFLPTTLKLLEGYRKLDYQPIEGENISNAKKEIEETLDTIVEAFENLLDDLFIDIAMDISTDISVLETMLAQEGLTKDKMGQRKL